METINNVLAAMLVTHSNGQQLAQELQQDYSSEQQVNLRAVAAATEVMTAITDIFTNSFLQKTDESVSAWAMVFISEKLNKRMVEAGKLRLFSLTSDKCPKCPMDFVVLCKKAVGEAYPDYELAYKQAANGQYSHEVIYETAIRVGVYELRSHSEATTKPIFKKIYQVVCDEYQAGARFTLPVARRLTDDSKPASQENAAKYLAEIKRQMGIAT
jgi:hypothetical protein